MDSFRYVSDFLIGFWFLFYEWEIFFIEINALNFSLSEDIFSLWTHFINEKHAQWNLDIKVKVFHESISCFMKCPWNCISWNDLKEKFQSISSPLNIFESSHVKEIAECWLVYEKKFLWIIQSSFLIETRKRS